MFRKLQPQHNSHEWWHILQGLIVMSLLWILLRCRCATCQQSNNFASDNTYWNISSNSANPWRFRDFAPRLAAGTVSMIAAANGHSATSKTEHFMVSQRNARGLHFEADDKDLVVELEFVIPFVRIPIERSLKMTQTAFRKLVDLNAGTLVLTGVLVVVGASIAGLVKLLSPQTVFAYNYGKKTRSADAPSELIEALNFVSYTGAQIGSVPTKSVSKMQDWLEVLEAKLHENEVNVSACAQRVICGYVQRAVMGVSAGQGTPVERIVDGLISLDILRPYLQDTALHRAIELGRQRDADACVLTYERCKWTNLQNRGWKVMLEYLKSFAGRNG